jgi:DNA-directed RNA polymerase subunit F
LPRKLIDSKPITTAEARKILERAAEDELGEFQRRTRDYTIKFSKIPASKAEKLLKDLSEKHQLERKDAIQLVNAMPNNPLRPWACLHHRPVRACSQDA